MSTYRLDDLIREGIKISDKTIGDLVRRDDEQVKSCAYGASQLGLENKEDLSTEDGTISGIHGIHDSLRYISTTEINSEDIPDDLNNYSPMRSEVWCGLYMKLSTL